MPANDSAHPAQRGRVRRSCPAIDARIATTTGVQPKMSALLATLVRATPARNSS